MLAHMAIQNYVHSLNNSRKYLEMLNLKLVRTPLNVYFTAFKSSFLSLYAHINSDECHA